jgi:LPS-assembly lipoprotein
MVLVAGCGFEPLHGRPEAGNQTTSALSQISVPPIPERLGQLLRIELTNQLTPLGPPQKPAYVLNVSVSEVRRELGVRKDATATRANLIITARFNLTNTQTNERLFGGSVRSINSYNILDADFATLTAEAAARRRGTRDLATEIGSRLGVFLAQPTGT